MLEDWIVVTSGVVLIMLMTAITLVALRRADRRMHERAAKLRAYTALLNAITGLNLACGDPYKTDIAKKNLAMTLNHLNLVGSAGVLRSASDLLDFLNEHKDKEYDTFRLHAILNALVTEARRDLDPSRAQRIEETGVRYRFYVPPRTP